MIKCWKLPNWLRSLRVRALRLRGLLVFLYVLKLYRHPEPLPCFSLSPLLPSLLRFDVFFQYRFRIGDIIRQKAEETSSSRTTAMYPSCSSLRKNLIISIHTLTLNLLALRTVIPTSLSSLYLSRIPSSVTSVSVAF